MTDTTITQPTAAPPADDPAPLTAPVTDVALIVPKHGKGKLLTGGKPGPKGPYNKASKNKVLKQITAELLAQIQRGIAKDKKLALLVDAGEPRALETATRIMESVHDRAYGKPVQANQLPQGDEEGEGAAHVRIVQIGNVSITF